MTIEQLHNILTELKIPAEKYYLHGIYGSTDDNDKLALTIKRVKYAIEYEVYFKEKGEKSATRTFLSEHEACDYFFNKIKDDWTFERINKIEGLGGMTVNERLHISGLMDEFDICKTKDMTRAKQILLWLRVDEPSIEQIINNSC
jgi:hypothetical protein